MALFTQEDSQQVEIKNKPLECHHCKNEFFFIRNDTTKPGLFTEGLDWAERPVKGYVCSECGFVHWFMK